MANRCGLNLRPRPPSVRAPDARSDVRAPPLRGRPPDGVAAFPSGARARRAAGLRRIGTRIPSPTVPQRAWRDIRSEPSAHGRPGCAGGGTNRRHSDCAACGSRRSRMAVVGGRAVRMHGGRRFPSESVRSQAAGGRGCGGSAGRRERIRLSGCSGGAFAVRCRCPENLFPGSLDFPRRHGLVTLAATAERRPQ